MGNYDYLFMSGPDDPREVIELLKKDMERLRVKLFATEVERDKYKGELERLRTNLGHMLCSDPACSTNNPRT
jgi:hypothetical protein